MILNYLNLNDGGNHNWGKNDSHFCQVLNFNLSLVKAPLWCKRISLSLCHTSLVHRTVLSLLLNLTYSSPKSAFGQRWCSDLEPNFSVWSLEICKILVHIIYMYSLRGPICFILQLKVVQWPWPTSIGQRQGQIRSH